VEYRVPLQFKSLGSAPPPDTVLNGRDESHETKNIHVLREQFGHVVLGHQRNVQDGMTEIPPHEK